MSKVLLFSDLHCHMHKASLSRLDDCLKVLEWVFETAIKRGIETIVFGGDLFQDRQKIHVISYEKTFRLIKNYCLANPRLKLFLLVGNHDMWYNEKWDVSSIAPLEAIKNVKVIAQPCAVEVAPDCTMDFLPYTKNPVEDVKTYFTKKNSILISHIALDGAQLSALYQTKAEISVEYEGDMVKVGIDNFKGWKKVLLGHYHCAQKLSDSVEYIGSPLELNFGEAFQQKHIIVLDTQTLGTEYVINDFSPKHLIIKESEVELHNLEGNFVQIIVDDITSTDIIDMKKSVKDLGFATLEFKEKPRKREKVSEEEHKEVGDKFDFSGGEVLERWAKAKGHGNMDLTKLIEIGQDIIRRS
jgi:DNA repair exonuclease SbcCD nuclease subunit